MSFPPFAGNALRIPILLLLTALLLPAEEQQSDPLLTIYEAARIDQLGWAENREQRLSVPLSRLGESITLDLAEPVATALLVRAEIVSFLAELSSRGYGLPGESVAAERLDEMSFRVRFPSLGIENSYRFSPPGQRLKALIDRVYENIYWEERVIAEYTGHYTVTVLNAEDCLPPFGVIDSHEALLAATLIAARHQPLWGIHDGLGFIDGLGYSLGAAANRAKGERSEGYRRFSANSGKMREILISLENHDSDLPAAIHALVAGMVQFERDQQFLLPEELLFIGEGDCLEFSLAYYDLLRREGVSSAMVLALDPAKLDDQRHCDYITVYQMEEFGPWGYLSYDGYGPPRYETWQEIPASLLRDKIHYYSIDADRILETGPYELPALQSWSLSFY